MNSKTSLNSKWESTPNPYTTLVQPLTYPKATNLDLSITIALKGQQKPVIKNSIVTTITKSKDVSHNKYGTRSHSVVKSSIATYIVKSPKSISLRTSSKKR